MLFTIARKSLLNRKTTALLTVFSIAISVFVLLSVEHIRAESRSSFGRTVSGVDLIVGARTGPLNLLLSSVFRIGNASNTVSWQSYQSISKSKEVKWSIPISLGDSHKGFRVMGTTNDYFRYFKFGQKQALSFTQGVAFSEPLQVVLGSEVAKALGYGLDQQIILSHGTGHVSFTHHNDTPFIISGVLAPTGTPVDRTLHVSLESIEAVHAGWSKGVKKLAAKTQHEHHTDLKPESITAFMLGLNSRIAMLSLQRKVNQFKPEPLSAIVPGVALAELWQIMGVVENILLVITYLVLIAALLGMCTMLLASMQERQRELAIVRAIGGPPVFVFLLVEMEAILLTIIGMGAGMALLWISLALGQQYLSDEFGLFVSTYFVSGRSVVLLVGMLGLSILVALVPALVAYRSAINSGLSSRQ